MCTQLRRIPTNLCYTCVKKQALTGFMFLLAEKRFCSGESLTLSVVAIVDAYVYIYVLVYISTV